MLRRKGFAPAFLGDFRDLRRQAPRLERILAIGRAFLTTTALAAIYVDPTEPARYAALTYSVLTAYAAYSFGILVFLPRVLRRPSATRALHGGDIVWTSVLTFFSQGPVSPFFLFFLFVVLAAAYRWGFRETLATTTIIIGIFVVETGVATVGPWGRGSSTLAFDPTPVITRITYLLLTGVLLGYLAEQDKALRAEIAAISHAVAKPTIELGFGASIVAIADLLRQVFRASAAKVVIRDHGRGRTMLWSVDDANSHADGAGVHGVQLAEKVGETWLFPTSVRTWYGIRNGSAGRLLAVSIDAETSAFADVTVTLPPRVANSHTFETMATVDFGLDNEWSGRALLFDPHYMPRGLHFLESLADNITPVLSNVFLLRRLRSRAGAAERARVARELHDGAIQALIGIELDAAAIRKSVEIDAPALTADLDRLQENLRQEVMALRELMQQLQPVELDAPHHLPEVLTGVVERFRRESGIAARFVSDTSTIGRLSLRTTHEIVRIVQEALVNVRKHSQARNVIVQLADRNGGYTLMIEDDGRGFPFEGRLTGSDLAARRIGPAMIKQRARIIGGTLALESTPGTGSRLEIHFDAQQRN